MRFANVLGTVWVCTCVRAHKSSDIRASFPCRRCHRLLLRSRAAAVASEADLCVVDRSLPWSLTGA